MAATAAAASDLCARINLYMRCKGLKNLDVLSKSDPFAVVFLNGAEVGQTEVKQNDLNPVWSTPVRIDYHFEELQRLKVEVRDADADRSQVEGFCETEVATVACSKGSSLTLRLVSGKGEITITAEEIKRDFSVPGAVSVAASDVTGLAVSERHGVVTQTRDITTIRASATGLDKKDLLGKSDPFLVVSREIGGAMCEIFRTDIVKRSLEPTWKPVEIESDRLGGVEKPLHIEVWDWDRTGKNDLIGTASCADVLACAIGDKSAVEVQLTSPPNKKGATHCSGTVRIAVERKVVTKEERKSEYEIVANSPMARDLRSYPVLRSPVSFLDMLGRGMKIQTACCIDFTGSNGSMHDIGSKPNPYEQCIEAVATVLQPYDSDGRFLFYGYGARIKKGSIFPPFFTVGETDEVDGVAGLLSTYRENRSRFDLGDMGSASGGDMDWRAHKHRYYCDDFYQLINHVSDMAEKVMKETAPPGSGRMPAQYFVLFFVIDGDGFDTEGTFRAIVRASALPISIVLVGVGNSGFGNLSSYDADDKPLRTKEGVSAVRDVVQFVKFNDFKHSGNVDMKALTAAVLAEVPHQVESFVALYGITP